MTSLAPHTTPADSPVAPVPESVLDYLRGITGPGSTTALNEQAWASWLIQPRMFRDVTVLDTSVTVAGHALPSPVLLAPWARHGLVHPEGELASARAARAAGAGFALSSGSSLPIEDVAEVSGPYLQQLYLLPERELVKPFLERAVAAGAWAIAVTVDAPTVATPHGFRSGIAGTDLTGAAWNSNFPDVPASSFGSAADLSAADLGWVADFTGLPVLAKGILHPEDAAIAIEAGAAGVVVSNHGGRQLRGGVPTALLLPEIVAAVAGRGTVLVDGGVRSGEDVLRALALGADAALVGAPAALALAAEGEVGLTSLLTEYVTGFERALALAGAASPAQLNCGHVLPA